MYESVKKYSRWMIALFLFVSSIFLFYRQSVGYEGRYATDLITHIEFAKSGEGYSFLYFLMRMILLVCKDGLSNIAISVFEGGLLVGTYIAACNYIQNNFDVSRFETDIIAAILFFLCAVYLPLIDPVFYVGSFITQPWHNITYIGMRLFGLFTMIAFFNVINDLDKLSLKNWLIIAILVSITTSMKPNFFIMFAPCVFLFLLADFWNKRVSGTGVMRILSIFIPTAIIILWQSYVLYGKDTNSGIALVFTNSIFFQDGWMICVIRILKNLLFPIIVFIAHRNDKNRQAVFIYVMYFISLVQALFLVETGSRAQHGNFWWGSIFGGYMLFVWCVPRYVMDVKEVMTSEKKMNCYILIGGALLIAHMISGAVYFGNCLSGGSYWI